MPFNQGRKAIVKLVNRRVFSVQGQDAFKFIQAILTNDMKYLTQPKQAIYGAFLNSKGRLIGDCHVIQLQSEKFLLDYDESVEPELLNHWKRYKLRMKVTLDDKSDTLSVLSIMPSIVSEKLEASVQVDTILKLNEAFIDKSDEAIFVDPRTPALGVRAIVANTEAVNTPDDYDTALSHEAYHDHRVLLGIAEGNELSDGIPLEGNLELLRGVSFTKGCYVGQELTARTQFKGNVRKRFVPLALVPNFEKELIKDLQQLTFMELNQAEAKPIRRALELPFAMKLPEKHTKIHKEGSTKAVGTLVSTGTNVNAAIAMLRLENLLPTDETSTPPLMQFHTEQADFAVVPFRPTWWSSLDPKTGKMIL